MTPRRPGGSTAIRVLIVEDHPLMARALRSLLEDHEDIRVVGEVTSAASAVAAAGSTTPDIVLMDYRLPDGSGADATRAIRDASGAAIVFLTADPDDDALLAAVEAGACGYIVKSEPPERVVEAVRRAAEGEILIPATVLRDLVGRRSARAREQAERARLSRLLTAREQHVLELMARGSSNQAIADQLGISLTTSRTHVRSILGKLDAHSKLEAVARAAEHRLLGTRWTTADEGAG